MKTKLLRKLRKKFYITSLNGYYIVHYQIKGEVFYYKYTEKYPIAHCSLKYIRENIAIPYLLSYARNNYFKYKRDKNKPIKHIV